MNAPKRKPAVINPLKMSQPLGASLAFLGIDKALPCMHGSQGCTAFALVLLVRHFREPIPLQTTAMNEISTIVGGTDNIEAAIENIRSRTGADLIGLCTTGLTETRDEDLPGTAKLLRQKRPDLFETCEVVFASTPDFTGGFEDGFGNAIQAVIEQVVVAEADKDPRRINILAGAHLTPGDVEDLRDLVESFGLTATILPDLGDSMIGRQPDKFTNHSLGGTRVADIRAMGGAALTLCIGSHMAGAGAALAERTGVPTRYLDHVTGLVPTDELVGILMEVSGVATPPRRVVRDREALVDAMLDSHFFTGRKTVALGLEPDLARAVAGLLTGMGCTIRAVVPQAAPALAGLDGVEVTIGDHDDLERISAEADLLIANAHARQGLARTGVPFVPLGLPLFDRLGAAFRPTAGYRGTRELVFDIANTLMHAEHAHGHGPDDWPLPAEDGVAHAPVATH